MTIPAVTGASAAQQTGTQTSQFKQTLDSEVFMRLLVTQLRNQDPSNPMDSSEMISQTAQLAQMEKVTQLADISAESFALQMRSVAATFHGRDVTYTNSDGTKATGKVTAVKFDTTIPTLVVGDTDVPLTQVTDIR